MPSIFFFFCIVRKIISRKQDEYKKQTKKTTTKKHKKQANKKQDKKKQTKAKQQRNKAFHYWRNSNDSRESHMTSLTLLYFESQQIELINWEKPVYNVNPLKIQSLIQQNWEKLAYSWNSWNTRPAFGA